MLTVYLEKVVYQGAYNGEGAAPLFSFVYLYIGPLWLVATKTVVRKSEEEWAVSIVQVKEAQRLVETVLTPLLDEISVRMDAHQEKGLCIREAAIQSIKEATKNDSQEYDKKEWVLSLNWRHVGIFGYPQPEDLRYAYTVSAIGLE